MGDGVREATELGGPSTLAHPHRGHATRNQVPSQYRAGRRKFNMACRPVETRVNSRDFAPDHRCAGMG